MNKFFISFLILFAPIHAYSASDGSDIADAYQCITEVVSKEGFAASPLESDQKFTEHAIATLANHVNDPLRQAFQMAAADAYLKTIKSSPARLFSKSIFFNEFISGVSEALPKYIDIRICADGGKLTEETGKDVLYDVIINRYMAELVGKGELHQWFVHHGGSYVEPAFLAALVGLYLNHKKYDLDAWQKFYTKHVEEKFHSNRRLN